MLEPPLGIVEIKIDNHTVEYECFPVSVDRTCSDLNGRYAIVVYFLPDKAEHTISCMIKNHIPSTLDGADPGENLGLFSLYERDVKVSIGVVGESGDDIRGVRQSDYDYDTEYLTNGVQYRLLPITKTSKYIFGVAWINKVTEENDVQTWYGADPTMPQFRKTVG